MHCLPIFSNSHFMYRNYSFVAILAFLTLTLFGCKDKAPKSTDNHLTDYEMVMTDRDTSSVVGLVDQFFKYVEAGDVASAAGMLYDMNQQKPLEEPTLLDNEQLKEVISTFSSFPIIDHHIDYIKFNEVYKNEVKVSAIIEHAHDGLPEMKTVFYFRPYDYVGEWRLCLMETLEGDDRIIKADEVDSLQQKFAGEQGK